MSRYNWYDLMKDGKIVGGGGALGQSDWCDDEILMDYVTFFLKKIDEECKLDEFDIIRSGHEAGPVEPIHCGFGVARYSKLPPKIKGNYLMFEDVTFKRKENE